MNKVRKSLLLSFAENYSAFIAQFIATLILARLLTPAEIGIYSVAVVMIGLAHTVRDFGVGQYLIQAPELNEAKIRAAFGIAILIAWMMAVLLALISYPAAIFYGEAGVGQAMRLLAVNFVLLPFATISLALWRREMNFGPPYIIKTAGVIVAAVTVITLAFLGFSYMSMAWGAVVGITTNVLLANLIRPPNMPWLPSLRESRAVLSWGGIASGAVVLKELGVAAPDLIIGRVLGMKEVGLFGRAMGLINLFERYVSSSVKGIILPHLSQVQRDGYAVRESYLRTLEMTSGVAWPFFAFVNVMAYPLIRVLYGDQWDQAVPIVQVLSLYGALKVLPYFADHTLLAVGATKRNLLLELLNLSILAAAILVGATYGLIAVALAMTISVVISTIVSYQFLSRIIHVRLRDALHATRGSAILAGATALGPWLLMSYLPAPSNLYVSLILGCGLGAMGWGLVIVFIGHPLKVEIVTYAERALVFIRKK